MESLLVCLHKCSDESTSPSIASSSSTMVQESPETGNSNKNGAECLVVGAVKYYRKEQKNSANMMYRLHRNV